MRVRLGLNSPHLETTLPQKSTRFLPSPHLAPPAPPPRTTTTHSLLAAKQTIQSPPPLCLTPAPGPRKSRAHQIALPLGSECASVSGSTYCSHIIVSALPYFADVLSIKVTRLSSPAWHARADVQVLQKGLRPQQNAPVVGLVDEQQQQKQQQQHYHRQDQSHFQLQCHFGLVRTASWYVQPSRVHSVQCHLKSGGDCSKSGRSSARFSIPCCAISRTELVASVVARKAFALGGVATAQCAYAERPNALDSDPVTISLSAAWFLLINALSLRLRETSPDRQAHLWHSVQYLNTDSC